MSNAHQHDTYQKVAKAIEYIAERQQQQPSLSEIAEHVGLSNFHFQRVFSDWVGLSPKQYLQYLTKEKAKEALQANTVLDAAYSLGLSGGGRLHDLMVSCEAMAPGEYKRQGKDLVIEYGFHSSPFGSCLIAVTKRGVCAIAFYDDESKCDEDSKGEVEQAFLLAWERASVVLNDKKTAEYADIIFGAAKLPLQHQKCLEKPRTLKLLIKGTDFQIKVWEALLAIPQGALVCYQDLADHIDAPKSVRAVASAIARNNIAYLIPCHRVIRQNGDFSQYRWGLTRKKALIAWEASTLQVERGSA